MPVKDQAGLADTVPMAVMVGDDVVVGALDGLLLPLTEGARWEGEGEGLLNADLDGSTPLPVGVQVPAAPVRVPPIDPEIQALPDGLALPDPPTLLLPLLTWVDEGVLESLTLPVPVPCAPLLVVEAEASTLRVETLLAEGVRVPPPFPDEGVGPPLPVPLPDPAVEIVASPFKEGDVVTEEQPLPSPLKEPFEVGVLVAGVVIETNGVPV